MKTLGLCSCPCLPQGTGRSSSALAELGILSQVGLTILINQHIKSCFFLAAVQSAHHVMLVSDVQHSESTTLWVTPSSPQVQLPSVIIPCYYNTIGHFPSAVPFIPVIYLFHKQKPVPSLSFTHFAHPLPRRLPFATSWMELVDIMLSEIAQGKTNTI